MSSVWDFPENVELLKKLRAEGVSNTRIGKRLGVSRNAVIGKASRLGLPQRGHNSYRNETSRPQSQRPRFEFARASSPRGAATAAGRAATGPPPPSFIVRKPRRNDPARPKDKAQFFDFHFGNTPRPSDGVIDLASDPSDPQEDRRVSFLDLERHHCRFPLGQPVTFCGRQHAEGSPYCEQHSLRAFKDWKPRKRITPPTGTPQGEPGHPTGNESADADGRRAAETQVHARGQISAPPAIHQQEKANG